jgi:hypothetical protein
MINISLKAKYQELGIGEVLAEKAAELAAEELSAEIVRAYEGQQRQQAVALGWKKQAEEAIKENERLDRANKEQLGALNMLGDAIREKEEKIAELAQHKQEAAEELDKERRKVRPGDRSLDAVERANKRAEEAEAKAKLYKDEADQKHQMLTGAENRASELEATIADYDKKDVELAASMLALQKAATKAKEAQHVAEEQKANAEETNRLAAKVIKERGRRIDELADQLVKEQKLSAEAAGMASKINELSAELEGYKTKEKAFIDAENSRAAEAERKAGRWLEECTKANEEANALKRKVNELTEEDQRMNGVCGRLQQERDMLANDLAGCQNRNARLEGRVKQLGEVNTRQTDAIFELKDKLNQKYEEAEKLEATIKELRAKPAYQLHIGPHPLELFTENAKLCFEVVRLQELLKTEKKAADALFVQRQEAYKRLEEIEMKATEITPTIREFLIRELKPVVSLNPLYVESLAQKIAGLVVSLKAKAINNTEARINNQPPNGVVQMKAGGDMKAGALVAQLMTDSSLANIENGKTIDRQAQLITELQKEKLRAEHEIQELHKDLEAATNSHRQTSAQRQELEGARTKAAGLIAKNVELAEQLEHEIKAGETVAEELGRKGGELGRITEELGAQKSQVTKLVTLLEEKRALVDNRQAALIRERKAAEALADELTGAEITISTLSRLLTEARSK